MINGFAYFLQDNNLFALQQENLFKIEIFQCNLIFAQLNFETAFSKACKIPIQALLFHLSLRVGEGYHQNNRTHSTTQSGYTLHSAVGIFKVTKLHFISHIYIVP